jgi:hypothetical protein
MAECVGEARVSEMPRGAQMRQGKVMDFILEYGWAILVLIVAFTWIIYLIIRGAQ